MISHDELLEAIHGQFPGSFVQGAEGRPKLRINRLRLATQALIARLVRAGVDIEVQGGLPTSGVLIETAARLSAETARTVGIGLPPLPPRPKCGPFAAALGMDLAVADAVVDRLWVAGLEHRRSGRYLYLDCKLGHVLRGLQLALPNNEWTGLDRRRAAVRWARQHVEGANSPLCQSGRRSTRRIKASTGSSPLRHSRDPCPGSQCRHGWARSVDWLSRAGLPCWQSMAMRG